MRQPSREYSGDVSRDPRGDASREASNDTSRRYRDDTSRGARADMSRLERRICEWCGGPIRPAARRDTLTCSRRCRQAKARFRVGPAGATASEPMRFAYADPPYPGMAWRYYRDEEVDHAELVARLVREFPHGWALSTSAEALPEVLALCPREDLRVCSWVKGPRPGVAHRARSAWEPVIVWRGRTRRIPTSEDLSDVLLWGGRQHSHPGALLGMKPAAFCEWVLRLLGVQVGDTLMDIYPGSGVMGRAFRLYVSSALTTATRSDRDTSCLADAERRLAQATAQEGSPDMAAGSHKVPA